MEFHDKLVLDLEASAIASRRRRSRWPTWSIGQRSLAARAGSSGCPRRAAAGALLREGVVGVGVYQGMEFVLQRGMRDVAGKAGRRAHARALLRRRGAPRAGLAAHARPRPRQQLGRAVAAAGAVTLDIVFAAESLLPARGGAERHALELLGALAARGHRVSALWLAGGGDATAAVHELPAGVSGRELAAPPRDPADYWTAIAARCDVLRTALQDAPRADLVISQLHAVPAAVASGPPTVVLLPSYESLCKVAHGSGATVLADRVELVCPPPRDCRQCPRALPGAGAARRAQDDALARAALLIAPSRAVARATRDWSGRDAIVVAPVGAVPEARGRAGGHVLFAAGTWAEHKGAALVEPIARALAGRAIVVTPVGLDDEVAARLRAMGAELRDAPIAELLDGAGACVIPSQWPEPFSRIAFEAQACGVPVVAPRNGGLAEHVVPACLVARDAQPQAYADACSRSTSPPPGIRRASPRARQRRNLPRRAAGPAVDAIEAVGLGVEHPAQPVDEALLGEPRRGRAARAGIVRQVVQRRARARDGDWPSTSLPVTPSSTMSSAPPARGATTGVPHACASAMTIPNSSIDGQTSAIADRYSSRSRSSSTQPVNVAWPPARARSWSSCRTRADHDRRQAGQPRGLDGVLDALVTHEARDDEDVAARRGRGREERRCAPAVTTSAAMP